jgi:hypothetical protein
MYWCPTLYIRRLQSGICCLLHALKWQRLFSFTPSREEKEAQMQTAANLKVWAAAFVGAPAAAVAAALVVLTAALGVVAGSVQPSRAADTALTCFGRQATITGSVILHCHDSQGAEHTFPA